MDSDAIHPIQMEEAADAFRLIRSALPEELLQYTVFLAPQATGYIKGLIDSSSEDEAIVRGITDRHELLACYIAHRLSNSLHLAYICTSDEAQCHGMGRLMMEDLYKQAVDLGCEEISLDVFRNNTVAYEWYRRLGFSVVASRFNSTVDLTSFEPLQYAITTTPGLDEFALMINRHGFGKVTANIGGLTTTLGAVGHDVARVMESMLPLDITARIARSLFPGRSSLLVMGLESKPEGSIYKSVSQVVRMRLLLSKESTEC